MSAARTEQELNKKARAERDQLALWLEDLEERVDKLEGKRLDVMAAATVFYKLASQLHREARNARNDGYPETATALGRAADLVLATTTETLLETVLTTAFQTEQGDDSDSAGNHPAY